MDIKQQTKNVAAQGRYGDSMLMHVNPAEVKGLASALPLTVNPQTGQPEAFLPFLAPLLGSTLFSTLAGTGALGATLAANSALASGIGAGLATYAQSGGSGSKALLSGLTAGLGSSAMNKAALAADPTIAQTATETALNTPGMTDVIGTGGATAGQQVLNQAGEQAVREATTGMGNFGNLKTMFTGPEGFSFDQGASALAGAAGSPSGMASAIGAGTLGIQASQEAFARQMGESEEAYRRRREEMYRNNPEPILYSAGGGIQQFDEGGFVDNLLSGDYGMLGMLNNNPELMFGATGLAAKNNFRGSLLGELYNQYRKRKDAGDEVGAAALQSEIQNEELMQMAAGGSIRGFNGEDESITTIYGGELPQIFAPAKQAYDVNPNFMAGFSPETMYFNPSTISPPASSLRGGSPPEVIDTYTGSKGGYGGRQASIAPQVSIDPFAAYTGQPPTGLEFTNTPVPMPIEPMPELPVPPVLPPDFGIGPIGGLPGLFNNINLYNPTAMSGVNERMIGEMDERAFAMTGDDLGITRPNDLGELLLPGTDNGIDISDFLGSREDNLGNAQAMFGPQVAYATGLEPNTESGMGLGLGEMMTAEELIARGGTPQPRGSGIFGKGPLIEPNLLMEDQNFMIESPMRERKTGGDTLKPIPEDNKGLPNLPKSVRKEMGYMQAGGMTEMQNDPLTQEVTMFILGETDNEQALNDFITKYGSDTFMQLREMVLQSIVPNSQTQGLIRGDGEGGMDDDLMGMIGDKERIAVSQDEFIVPADVVSMLGDGSSDAGSKELYDMMDRVRKEKTGTTKQAPKLANAGGLLPA